MSKTNGWAKDTLDLIIKSATLLDIQELIILLENYLEEETQENMKAQLAPKTKDGK